ncbi:MAG: response regulator [bacterium]|nr:response regulator [bacterium]
MQGAQNQINRPKPGTRSVVLVVDDERGPRESLRMILQTSYDVVTAEGGESALEVLRSRRVDLVTVDLNMPGIKGDELVEIVRREFPETEIIVITGFATIDAAVGGIRKGVGDFLTKPFDVVQVEAAVTRALDRQRERRRLIRFLEGVGRLVGHDRDADGVLREFEHDERLRGRLHTLLDLPQAAKASERADGIDPRLVEFLQHLADTVERRDTDLPGHARRVSFYAGLIADRMKLSDEERAHTRFAARIHDLGKLGLAPGAMTPGCVLSPAQRREVQRHPVIGEQMLEPLGLPSVITQAIRHHHERCDGTGYPDGIASEAIPVVSRIIAVADAFDAIICRLDQAPTVGRRTALRELEQGAGQQFDARVVGVLVEIAQIRLTSEMHTSEIRPSTSPNLATATPSGEPHP